MSTYPFFSSWQTSMTFLIAILALIVSALVLLIQYKNQVERRHGEIVQLRDNLLSTLSNHRQRLTSLYINAQTIRIELRRLPDSEGKFESIETLPHFIQQLESTKQIVDDLVAKLDKTDTTKINRSKVLLALQSAVSEYRKLESDTRKIEDRMIALLDHIRSCHDTQQADAANP